MFGEDYIDPQFASDSANALIESLIGPNTNRVNDASWAAYEQLARANPAMIADLQKRGGGVLDQLGQVSSRLASTDPRAAANEWANAQMARFNDQLQKSIGADSATAKLARARLGFAGRPEGSFDHLMRSADYAKASLPALQQLLGQAAGDAGSFSASDRSNIGALLAHLQGIPGFQEALAQSIMRPATAARAAGANTSGTLADFINAAKANFLGFEQKRQHGVGDYLTTGSKVIADTTGNLASAYGNLYGMGAFGGGGPGKKDDVKTEGSGFSYKNPWDMPARPGSAGGAGGSGWYGDWGAGGGGGGGGYVPSGWNPGSYSGWDTVKWGN